ncbi:hypothetical protein F3Y22_tig00110388pilonHSYRG00277 [Hibiscus syriacus]|uniref:Uncharacterized protein n=1 Tax=Hibiscus syriacus TaxID=106335 RepID=A0A6A3ARB8_HIBSY|nr:hypothetical protein F3Y22_tig00110388pilonHSYRG00277 [Hibiscus syriacus]
MKQLVTIVIGVSYERKNIDKGFNIYNKRTCRATMQPLHNFDSILDSTPFKEISLKEIRAIVESGDDMRSDFILFPPPHCSAVAISLSHFFFKVRVPTGELSKFMFLVVYKQRITMTDEVHVVKDVNREWTLNSGIKDLKKIVEVNVYKFWTSEEYELEVTFGQLRRFSWREIQLATDDFKEGQHNWTIRVYRVVLSDNTKIAVKHLTNYYSPNGEAAFQREIQLISVVVHMNLLHNIN